MKNTVPLVISKGTYVYVQWKKPLLQACEYVHHAWVGIINPCIWHKYPEEGELKGRTKKRHKSVRMEMDCILQEYIHDDEIN